jgi:hypothetical protein
MTSVKDEIAPYIVSCLGQLILHGTAIHLDKFEAEKLSYCG